MIELEIHIPQDELDRLVHHFPGAVQSGLRRVATHVQQIAIRKAGAIYRRAIPSKAQVNAYRKATRAGRRAARPKRIGGSTPAWERSGDLLRAVEAEPTFERTSVTLSADVVYGTSRETLGVKWTPKKPALGIVRRDPFFTETAEIVKPQLTALFEDGVREELGL